MDPRTPRHRLAILVLVLALLAMAGCSTLAYVAHVARGQSALMRSQKPISDWLADPATPAALRADLAILAGARRFASATLKLPDNASYTGYAQLSRPFVTWAVVAAPEFSVSPTTHCLPFSGCVPYLGYFDPAAAEKARTRLAARGLDTYVGGVAAYSTLGWFDDPVLSTMLRAGAEAAIGVVFHELAHQQLYVPDDTAFNESLASFVEEEGLRQWRVAAGLAPADGARTRRTREFSEQVRSLHDELAMLYARPLAVDAKRAAKAAAFAAFRARHHARRQGEWRDFDEFDGWVDGPLNNAALQPFLLYDRWLPAFAALFRQAGGDWAVFHDQCRRLARLPAAQREARLAELERLSP